MFLKSIPGQMPYILSRSPIAECLHFTRWYVTPCLVTQHWGHSAVAVEGSLCQYYLLSNKNNQLRHFGSFVKRLFQYA